MRVTLLALISLSLMSAGCFGGDDDDGGGDGTPTPDTTPTNTTPTTTPVTTPTTTPTPTTPEGPAPSEVYSESGFNFARPPPEAPTTEAFEVPEGYTSITLNVTFSLEPDAAPVAVNNGISVTITGPGGTSLTCSPPASGPAPADIPVCTQVGTNPEAGEWTAAYAGEGTYMADVQVIAA